MSPIDRVPPGSCCQINCQRERETAVCRRLCRWASGPTEPINPKIVAGLLGCKTELQPSQWLLVVDSSSSSSPAGSHLVAAVVPATTIAFRSQQQSGSGWQPSAGKCIINFHINFKSCLAQQQNPPKSPSKVERRKMCSMRHTSARHLQLLQRQSCCCCCCCNSNNTEHL